MAPPNSLASSITSTHNTAPVYKYRCLFSHDLRRKAKRWQDGFAKFHTFNKRVMVYDTTSNFIGDTHHRDGEALEDGDELELERGGVLVQVGERVATEETDISALVTRRQPKPLEENDGVHLPSQLQPRSTNLNIPPRTPGRWSGWTGRAQIPQESPFAQKHAEDKDRETQESGRPAKRQRTEDDEHVPLWQILKRSRPAFGGPQSSAIGSAAAHGSAAPADARPSSKPAQTATSKRKKLDIPQDQARLHVTRTIDLRSSPELPEPGDAPTKHQTQDRGGVYNSSSPAKPAAQTSVPTRRTAPAKVNIVQAKLSQTVNGRQLGALGADVSKAFRPPSSSNRPVKQRRPPREALPEVVEEPVIEIPEREEFPIRQEIFATSKDVPSMKARSVAHVQPKKPTISRPVPAPAVTPSRLPPSSPPVSTRNHITTPVVLDLREDEPAPPKAKASEKAKPPMKPIRLGGSSRPKMLMCQMPVSRPATPATGTKSAELGLDNDIDFGPSVCTDEYAGTIQTKTAHAHEPEPRPHEPENRESESQQAKEKRRAEERRQAGERQHSEERRQAEERRKVEKTQQDQDRRLAEQRRLAEERRQANKDQQDREIRQAEERQRVDERRQAEKPKPEKPQHKLYETPQSSPDAFETMVITKSFRQSGGNSSRERTTQPARKPAKTKLTPFPDDFGTEAIAPLPDEDMNINAQAPESKLPRTNAQDVSDAPARASHVQAQPGTNKKRNSSPPVMELSAKRQAVTDEVLKSSKAKDIPAIKLPHMKVDQSKPTPPLVNDRAQSTANDAQASIPGMHPDQLQADFILHKASHITPTIQPPQQKAPTATPSPRIAASKQPLANIQAPATTKPAQPMPQVSKASGAPISVQTAVTTAKSILPPPTIGQPVAKPPNQSHRPLRRTASDAGTTSPTKQSVPTNGPVRNNNRTFGRSSTIANPNNATKERQKAQAQAQVQTIPEVDEAALQREKRLSDERNATGPWTKEAWDLFGFSALPRVVKEKKEIEAWEYGPEAPVQPRSAGEVVGTAVVNMNEVRALGGFVNANTGRASVAA